MLIIDLKYTVVATPIVFALVICSSVKPALPIGEAQPLVEVPLGKLETVVQLQGKFAAVIDTSQDGGAAETRQHQTR